MDGIEVTNYMEQRVENYWPHM